MACYRRPWSLLNTTIILIATTAIRTRTRLEGGPSSVAGRLRLRVERRGDRTALIRADGHVPYAPRLLTIAPAGWARVTLVQTVAGPLAGDSLDAEIDVGPGAALELITTAATVALPADRPARHCVAIRIAAGGRLAWLPEPVIASAGCHFIQSFEVELATQAALLCRETVVLGRHDEQPGRYLATLCCDLGGTALLRDTTDIGASASSPAILGNSRAYGALALLGLPGLELTPSATSAGIGVFSLAGPGQVVRAMAASAAELRRRLSPLESVMMEALHPLPTPARRSAAQRGLDDSTCV